MHIEREMPVIPLMNSQVPKKNHRHLKLNVCESELFTDFILKFRGDILARNGNECIVFRLIGAI